MKKLSEILFIKRTDRPDEWSMDELARRAKVLEDELEESRNLLREAYVLLSECKGGILDTMEALKSE